MKRKTVIVLLTILALSMFTACGNEQTASNSNNNNIVNNENSTNIESESQELKDDENTTAELSWIPLAELTTYQDTLRLPLEEVFNTKLNAEKGEKEGHLYRDHNGITVQNNTLYGVLANTTAKQILEKDYTISALSEAALNTYIDLDDTDEATMKNFYMAINGYFNLLPDTEEGYSNADTTLTRAEFMAMLMRAETPVDTTLKVEDTFADAVGNSEYNLYAQEVEKDAYINLSDKSLNNQTYNGTITRAEAIYLLMNHYFADELVSLDLSKTTVTFTDAKDGGDIASAQDYTKDYGKSYEIVYALNNPAAGLPTDIYKALIIAEKRGLIDSSKDTRWDEGITKSEAIEFMYKTLTIATAPIYLADDNTVNNNTTNDTNTGSTENAGNTENNTSTDKKDPSYYINEWGTFDYGWEEADITREEDLADGWLGFTVHKDEGAEWSYVTYNKDGTRYDIGDLLPNNKIYTGADAEEYAAYEHKLAEDYANALKELREEGN